MSARVQAEDAARRVEFLQKARRVLSTASPAVSAYLGAQHRILTPDQDESQVFDTCRACGFTFDSTSSRMEILPPASNAENVPPRERLVYHCGKCDNENRLPFIDTRAPKRVKTKDRPTGTAIATHPIRDIDSSATIPTPASAAGQANTTKANQSSKQRAKARKQGLQAMIEKSKRDPVGIAATQLDMMDFMKPG